jgi:hypothetical protein
MKIVKWGVGIFLGLAVLGALLPSEKDTSNPITQVADKARTDQATAKVKKVKTVKKVKKDDDKTGVVGQKLTNAGTTYRVTDVRTTKTLGDQEYGMGEKANGTFVVVDLALTNNKDETKTFMDNGAKIVTADGSKYEADTDASIQLEDSLMLEDIQPDLTTKGQIGYDIPESKLSGAKLVIEDLWGHGEVTVDLGL